MKNCSYDRTHAGNSLDSRDAETQACFTGERATVVHKAREFIHLPFSLLSSYNFVVLKTKVIKRKQFALCGTDKLDDCDAEIVIRLDTNSLTNNQNILSSVLKEAVVNG